MGFHCLSSSLACCFNKRSLNQLCALRDALFTKAHSEEIPDLLISKTRELSGIRMSLVFPAPIYWPVVPMGTRMILHSSTAINVAPSFWLTMHQSSCTCSPCQAFLCRLLCFVYKIYTTLLPMISYTQSSNALPWVTQHQRDRHSHQI